MFIDLRRKNQCEREISIGCLLDAPQLGIELATLLVYGMVFQPTELPDQGSVFFN